MKTIKRDHGTLDVDSFGQFHIHFGGGRQTNERLALVFASGFAAAVAAQSAMAVTGWWIPFACPVLAAA